MFTVVFRCDASAEIGFGHLMRCVALAEWLQACGARVRILIRQDPGASRVLEEAGISAVWLPVSCAAARAIEVVREEVERLIAASDPVPWVVVDSYDRPELTIDVARQSGALVLVVDDLGGVFGAAQIILNQNLGAAPGWYPGATGVRLLLGPSYALLRRDWLGATRRQDAASPVRRILVTLGGSDRCNRTALVLRGLATLPESLREPLDVEVVLGLGFQFTETIRALAATVPYRCRVHAGVPRLSELMGRADLAITAVGGTAYETAYLGIPSLTLTLSPNQEKNAEAFVKRGLAVSLGRAEELQPLTIGRELVRLMQDRQARTVMNRLGRTLVDGRGPERIHHAMQALTPQQVGSR